MERLFLECAVRAALIVAGAAIVLYAFRVKAAAVKHGAWTGVVVLMLLLPMWTAWGPKAPVRVLPPLPEKTANEAITPLGALSTTVLPSNAADLEISAAPSRPAVSKWQVALLGIYLLGFFSLLMRLAIGTVMANRLVRHSVPLDGRPTNSSCAAPVTVGWLHPTVILPESWRQWPQEQLDAVLTHEQEHARRRDPLVQWLARLNRAVFWFHPAAWWLEYKLSALAEEACDSAVLARGHNPRDYSEYLLDMARSVMRFEARLNVVGMAMPGCFLTQRIRQIVEGRPVPRISRTRMASVAVACAITCTVFAAGTLDHAQLNPSAASANAKRELRQAAGYGRPQEAEALAERMGSLKSAALLSPPPGPWLGQASPNSQAPLAADDRPVVFRHRESQIGPVYALELSQAGKTGPHLLRHSDNAKCMNATPGPPPRPDPSGTLQAICGGLVARKLPNGEQVRGNKITWDKLASLLSGSVDRPVFDRTGLSGVFDFDLTIEYTFPPDRLEPLSVLANLYTSSLAEALQEQLGLKLVPQTGPIDVFVIDHMEQPSEN